MEMPAAAASVGGDGVNNVRAGGDLKNMGLEGVGGVSGDDDWGLGLVLGARRTATGGGRRKMVCLSWWWVLRDLLNQTLP